MDGLMTVEEVARLLRLNQVTIRRYIRSGRLKAVQVGGRIRMRREDVEQFARPIQRDSGTPSTTEDWEPISEDDPLFALIGTGRSGIPGGISGDKYRQFPKAFGPKR